MRVIELDLWPNSSKDDVRVLHGRYKLILKSISFDYVVSFLCFYVSRLCFKFFKYLYVANVMRDEFLIEQHMLLLLLLFSILLIFLHHCLNHFGTLTSTVKLIKCLKSIKEHAFVESPYPLIIT